MGRTAKKTPPPTLEGVASFQVLLTAARRAARGKRLADDALRFLERLEPEVLALERELRSGRYRPGPYRTFLVRDPKPRRISAAPFRDRVVHHAIAAAVEPVLERLYTPTTFACRPRMGTSAALAHVRAAVGLRPWFTKLDVRHYFESVPHPVLERFVTSILADAGLQDLLVRIIRHGAPGSAPGHGLPIGNLTSQHLANGLLAALDHRVVERLGAGGHARYMDDIVLLGEKPDVVEVDYAVRRVLRERLGLEVKEEVCRRGPTRAGVPFLGFVFFPGRVRLHPSRARRFEKKQRAIDEGLAGGLMCEEDAAASARSACAWIAQGDTAGLRRMLGRRRKGRPFPGARGPRGGDP